ncbi:TPM domain-containing protein [Niallia sp. 03133]|uniref:TPM domain-containing protein n=1 Tax=Niallia sp. 03133 TaxID=3458060 RepID=UPI0040448F8A
MVSKFFSGLFAIFILCFTSGNALAAGNDIPKPVGDIYVQDFANLLSDAEKQELNSIGRSIEDQTTAQVAVLTVKTIGNESIDDYANKAFRQYGIGNKQKNNGVLLVIATEEKKVRIEVGYGLEGRIPDGKAGRILDEYTLPYLKNQEPNKAITETYKVLANEVYAEYNIDEQQQLKADKPAAAQDDNSFPSWIIIIIVIVALFLDIKFFGGTFSYAILSILSRGGGRGGGGGGPKGGGGGSSGGGGASRGW